MNVVRRPEIGGWQSARSGITPDIIAATAAVVIHIIAGGVELHIIKDTSITNAGCVMVMHQEQCRSLRNRHHIKEGRVHRFWSVGR